MESSEGQPEQELKFDPTKPTLGIVMGPAATGKSRVALALQGILDKVKPDPGRKALVFRTDVIRKKMFGPEYDASKDLDTYKEMLRLAGKALRVRRSVVLNATFSRPETREMIQKFIVEHPEANFIAFMLTADWPVVERRMEERTKEGKDPSQAVSMETYREHVGRFTDNSISFPHYRFDNTPMRTVEEIQTELKRVLGPGLLG